MRAEELDLGDQVFIPEEQALVYQARYVSQQPNPLVLAHGERTSYAVWRRISVTDILAIRAPIIRATLLSVSRILLQGILEHSIMRARCSSSGDHFSLSASWSWATATLASFATAGSGTAA